MLLCRSESTRSCEDIRTIDLWRMNRLARRSSGSAKPIGQSWGFCLLAKARATLPCLPPSTRSSASLTTCSWSAAITAPRRARGWTETVRLCDLGSTIAALTATDALHVKRLDVASWARFLQILEDAAPAWVVSVLYGPAAQNITTREALKNLLTTNNPGGVVPVSRELDALAPETVK